MTKRCFCTAFLPQFAICSRYFRAASAVCLSTALALPMSVSSAERYVPSAAPEESVLVATRELPPSDSANPANSAADNGNELQPIAESSDRTPELAQPNEGSSRLQFEAGMSKLGEAAATESPKVIRRTPTVEDAIVREPVKFQGVTVGTSVKQEVLDVWGKPAESVDTAEGTVLVYDIDPFQAVEVLIGGDDVVSAIKVALSAPLDPKYLTEQLALTKRISRLEWRFRSAA
jgi:hypothetical protein